MMERSPPSGKSVLPSAGMRDGGNDKEEVGRKAEQDRYLDALFHAAVWAPL